MKITGVIPARFASTRFPGKVLASIHGKPMVQWVYENACHAKRLNRVIVATDDKRVEEAVRKFGGEVQMTSGQHQSGTDRIAEVAEALDSDIIVNVQGDEPGMKSRYIDTVTQALTDDPDSQMATICSKISTEEELSNPNIVKVVLGKNGYALYFSRSEIPCNRDGHANAESYRHIGLYAYRRNFLLKFKELPQTPLEKTECLEQLRALENGYKIKVAITDYKGIGVDTPEDLDLVKKTSL